MSMCSKDVSCELMIQAYLRTTVHVSCMYSINNIIVHYWKDHNEITAGIWLDFLICNVYKSDKSLIVQCDSMPVTFVMAKDLKQSWCCWESKLWLKPPALCHWAIYHIHQNYCTLVYITCSEAFLIILCCPLLSQKSMNNSSPDCVCRHTLYQSLNHKQALSIELSLQWLHLWYFQYQHQYTSIVMPVLPLV